MAKTKLESQPKLKLYYFDIKGKGEPIRLLCAYAGLELEDYRFKNRDEFTKMKHDGSLAFGQVPMLQVDETTQLVQTAAILRYLSKLTGLYPTNDHVLAAQVDAALDQETDAFVGATVVTYTTRFGIDLDDAHKKKAYSLLNEEVLPRHLKNLESLLQKSTTGWVVSTEEPSPPDFAWYCRLADYLPNSNELTCTLDEYPACKAFVAKFQALEEIKAYYASS